MSDPYKIGYVGLGNIGVQVCNNLGRYASSNNLPPLSIWNRSPEKYTQVAEDCKGAHLAKEVEEVVERSNVIFTCLLDDTAAENVYGKMFEAVKGEGEEGLVFADQSTLNPKTASEYTGHTFAIMRLMDRCKGKLQANAQQVGVTYLSCPVFGQVAAAKAAQIVLVISGAEAGRERIKPMLVPAIGRATIDVGEDAGKGGPGITQLVYRKLKLDSCRVIPQVTRKHLYPRHRRAPRRNLCPRRLDRF